MPPGIEQAYFFQIFNTISWQIVQGLPISLFVKHLGASDTILALAAAMNPLMNMLQIPAARHVERIDYRAFVLRGWSARTLVIAVIMLVPLLIQYLGNSWGLILTLSLLFVYSALRGISICGFLPWITQLIPENIRGTYISYDQMFGSIAGLLTMLGVAALFYPHPSSYSFAFVFLISFVSGLISLSFLRKMPDVPVPHQSESREKVPWLSMLLFPPFFKVMRYNMVMNSALASAGVFWICVLRATFHWNDSEILEMGAFSTLTSIGTLWFFGKMIDRVGSRPLLHFAGGALAFHYTSWFLVAARVIPMNHWSMLVIATTGGIGPPLYNLANTRLVMATVPENGRSHFFALYSVLNSLILGLIPIAWGIILDSLRLLHWQLGAVQMDHYSLLFLFLALTMILAFPLREAIKEQRAMSSEEFFRELFLHTPNRAITRLLRGKPLQ